MPLVVGPRGSQPRLLSMARFSAPAHRMFRIRYSGSSLRPGGPWTSCCTRRRTSSTTPVASKAGVRGVRDGAGVVELVVDGALAPAARAQGGDLCGQRPPASVGRDVFLHPAILNAAVDTCAVRSVVLGVLPCPCGHAQPASKSLTMSPLRISPAYGDDRSAVVPADISEAQPASGRTCRAGSCRLPGWHVEVFVHLRQRFENPAEQPFSEGIARQLQAAVVQQRSVEGGRQGLRQGVAFGKAE